MKRLRIQQGWLSLVGLASITLAAFFVHLLIGLIILGVVLLLIDWRMLDN